MQAARASERIAAQGHPGTVRRLLMLAHEPQQMALVIIMKSAIPRVWGVYIASPWRCMAPKGAVDHCALGIAKAIP